MCPQALRLHALSQFSLHACESWKFLAFSCEIFLGRAIWLLPLPQLIPWSQWFSASWQNANAETSRSMLQTCTKRAYIAMHGQVSETWWA